MGSTPTHSQEQSSSGEELAGPSQEICIGEWVQDRFKVRRLLGEGGMGRVYLAHDNKLARSVALKLVRAGVGTAQATRILNEARALAQVSHPHIIQVHEVGEHRGTLFLALEYVEGDTLKDRVDVAALSKDEVFRHGRAIAEALAHAHEKRVYHCDLKPSNIMVGRDGRLRVVDFGIAQTTEVTSSQVAGTPEWMAPEQWNGDVPSDRTDVWALAIIIGQLLTGHHPLGDDAARRREVCLDASLAIEVHLPPGAMPLPLEELIRRSLQRDPGARPRASDWVKALDDLVSGRAEVIGEASPYRGLAAFDEQHARFFFGRDADVDLLLERLRTVLCLPIVGPSGVGKSSFLHAGVIPRLRAREPWTVISFRPGDRPIATLARHVIASTRGAQQLSDVQLKAEALELENALSLTPSLLAVRLATVAAMMGSKVLLAVDQFEEVFTHCTSERIQRQFIEMLLGAADDALDPVRVLFTVRDDFVGRIVGLTSVFVMRKMSAPDLERTIVAPLQRCGYRFEDPAIVQEMLAEVASAHLAVPMVQFACRALWDGRDAERRLLLRSVYEQMGGVAGALGRHAEEALAGLSVGERRAARDLLLQLVDRTSRRTVSQGELLRGATPQLQAVLERLLQARLLVQRTQGDSAEHFVEIVHESLLVNWPQLVAWMEESQEERRFLAELAEAAGIWGNRGHRVEDTWSLEDLEAARHRAAKLGLTMPTGSLEFLAAGELHQRHLRRQRRRRNTLLAAAVSGIAGLVAAAAIWIGGFRTRDIRAQQNIGVMDFSLHPFDYVDGHPVPVDANDLPTLRWTLYSSDRADPEVPGAPLPAVTPLGHVVNQGARVDHVEAPGGGPAFLKIEGRGRTGEDCAPSWIRIATMPGYAEARREMTFEVPTCRASRWGMIDVEAGPFIYGGPAVPASVYYGKPDYTEPEISLTLTAFAIDRTEVPNQMYAPFARMSPQMGYRAPEYGNDEVHAFDHEADRPVSDISFDAAHAFCRFLGKELPSDAQWVKAARGGLTIAGRPNPQPRRIFPWGGQSRRECFNVEGVEDGFRWVAPVTAFACGQSPYGVLNLVGNVEEWISREGQSDKDNSMYAVRAGSAESPLNLEHHTTVFRNHRQRRWFSYAIGVRCASDERHEGERHEGPDRYR